MKRKIILASICLLVFVFSAFAQETVTGKVTNASDNQGIPGVNVRVKGSTVGVSTQTDGSYSIKAARNATLVFGFLGFKSQEVTVNGRSVVNVTLSEDATSLEDVVITALGIKRSEKSLGYATQSVSGDDLTLTNENNVIGSLAGKIAGVQVTGSSGANMGGTQKIKIRSVNSLTGGGQALIVVDGTPIAQSNFSGSENGVDYGNISQDINPEDIQSVNVLKGPAASALYGIRGQYGVILITTKRGTAGAKKLNIAVSSSFSAEHVSNFLPLQNLYGVGNNQTFLTLAGGQKYINGNDESWGPLMDGTPVRMYYSFYPQDPRYGQTTPFSPQPNNIKDFFETGQNVNNSISITGGGEASNYRMSYTNAYVNGVIPNTWLKRNNFGLAADFKLTDKLTVGTNVNYANNNGQRPTQGYQGSFTGATQWFQRNMDINELRDYKYADGTIKNWNVNPNTTTALITNNKPSDWNNPFFDAYEVLNNDNRDRLFGDINVNYQLLPELKVSAFLRSDMYTQNITHKEPLGGRLVDSYQVGKYQNRENNYEFLAQYAKTWDDFSFNANAGANLYTLKYTQQYQATAGGLSSPGLFTAANSVDRPTSTSYLREKEIRSVYAMGSFGYKDTYFIDASIRNDVSSTLPVSNNSYWYPSVSGSFVFSQLTNWKPLTFGKLRASYAIAGSDLSPYQTTFAYGLGSVYTTAAGTINTLLVPDNIKNPNIQPSFANSFEIGVDTRFFNNRLGMGFTWYQQKNKNQIINLSVSGASGFDNTVINAGLIENNGIELSLTGTPLRSKDFSWDMTFNYARNKNAITELYGNLTQIQLDLNTYSSRTVYLNSELNKSFGNLVGPGYINDPATGKHMLGTDNMPLFDSNKNFGSVLPKYTGGLMNSFKFKNFELAAMIDFQKGGQFFSWTKMLAVKSGQAAETAVLNDKGFNVRDPLASGGGYKINGISAATGAEVTAYVDARSYFRNNIGTRIYDEWLYDASYIKLREVSLAYTVNGKLLGKTPFKSIRIAAIARNPWMIWQKAPKGLDPTELSSGSSTISWIEKGELQTVRSYGVNLNLTF